MRLSKRRTAATILVVTEGGDYKTPSLRAGERERRPKKVLPASEEMGMPHAKTNGQSRVYLLDPSKDRMRYQRKRSMNGKSYSSWGNITLWGSTERVKRPQTFWRGRERCPRGADDVADIEIPSMLLQH